MDPFLQELRHAARILRQSPGFTGVAIITLALGMGANIAIFTLADALYLHPMAVRQPSQLVRLSSVATDGRPAGIVGAAIDLIDQQHVFDGMCGANAVSATVEINGRFAPIRTDAYTGSCFPTLGVGAAVGRVFAADDDRAGTSNVAVLAYDEWVQDFGASPSVVGTTVNIEGAPFEIIGVAARGYNGILVGFPARMFWLYRDQMTLGAGLPPRATMPMTVFARLRSGTSDRASEGRLRAIWREVLRQSLPPQYASAQRDQYLRREVIVGDGATGFDYSLRPRFRTALSALLIISGAVLCIACVNLAGLLITRAQQKRHETEVRVALGASPLRLVMSVLIEGLMLLIAAAAVSMPVAHWVDRLLVRAFTDTMTGFGLDLAPSGHVWMFLAVLAGISFIMFVIVPALTVTRVDASRLASGSNRVTDHRRQIRIVITTVQVALTVVLVAVGVTFVAVLHELKSESLGIAIDRLVGTQLAAVPGGYQRAFSASSYYRDLLRRIDALPHVVSSSLSQPLPMAGASNVVPVGTLGSATDLEAEQVRASDAFFSTLDIAILRGQSFASSGDDEGVRTTIISQSLARDLFGSVDVVGRFLRAGRDPRNQRLRIIGVVSDAMVNRPHQVTRRTVYLSFWQADSRTQAYPSLTIRLNGNDASIAKEIERAVRSGGREYPLGIKTLTDLRDMSLIQERLLAVVATAYGSLGLAVVLVGLFGLISYSVAQRTTELGIRLALGATSNDIVSVVVNDALTPVVVGGALGVVASLSLAKMGGTFLYGGTRVELTPIAVSVTLLIITAACAAFIPAKRASQLDPMSVLRRTQ